jgi:hypothetical protein
MTVRNLTPHSITVLSAQNVTPAKGGKFEADPTQVIALVVLPSEGVARVSVATTDQPALDLNGVSVPTVSMTFSDPVDLPPETPGVFLLVSSLLASSPAVRGRHDLLTPAKQVVSKDNPSQIIGCLALSRV